MAAMNSGGPASMKALGIDGGFLHGSLRTNSSRQPHSFHPWVNAVHRNCRRAFGPPRLGIGSVSRVSSDDDVVGIVHTTP
jgi:hypothetical protein